MTVSIRGSQPADADICGSICFRAFEAIAEAHGFPPDFPDEDMARTVLAYILARSDVYGVVAQSGGAVIGSNFLWEGDPIAGIGPITVDPEAQDRSVGRRLMLAVLSRAEANGHPGVRLVQAAYHSRSLSLYTKLGFVAREPLSTLQGPALAKTLPGHPVRAAVMADVEICNRLCSAVHGVARDSELQSAVEYGTATVVERGGRITGYASALGFFGHAVCESNDDLKALIAAAPEFTGPGILLPTRNADVLRWCLEHGLRIVQPMTLMSLGLYNEPAGAFIPSILY